MLNFKTSKLNRKDLNSLGKIIKRKYCDACACEAKKLHTVSPFTHYDMLVCNDCFADFKKIYSENVPRV